MKFNLTPVEAKSTDLLTVEDVIQMYEDIAQAKKTFRKEMRDYEVPASFNHLITELDEKGVSALESLSDVNLAEIAHVFSCDVADIKVMPVKDLIDKCDNIVAAQESGVELAIAGAFWGLLFGYVLSVVVISIAMRTASTTDFKSIYRKLDEAFQGKNTESVLSDIAVTTFTYKEFTDQIKAINQKVLPILKTDGKTIFAEKYPLKNIEAAAAALWAAPESVMTDDYSEYDAFWAGWSDNIPARTRGKTLGELGFTEKGLVETAQGVSSLCRECITLRDSWQAASKSAKDATSKGNIIARIVNWWRDDKETKEEKARLRKVASAKLTAYKALISGTYEMTNILAADMLMVAKKVEMLVKNAK